MTFIVRYARSSSDLSNFIYDSLLFVPLCQKEPVPGSGSHRLIHVNRERAMPVKTHGHLIARGESEFAFTIERDGSLRQSHRLRLCGTQF
jgi:hypothetical protein